MLSVSDNFISFTYEYADTILKVEVFLLKINGFLCHSNIKFSEIDNIYFSEKIVNIF